MELRPERALHWPERGVLAVADLHWGKSEAFQHFGIPLPSGVLEDDLARLSAALATALAETAPLTSEERAARSGLASRQVTIR